MTHPRKHDNASTAFVNDVQLMPGVVVSLRDYARLVDAYLADHPDHQPARPGIRGAASRLGLPGLPPGWERPYLHLLGIDAPDPDAH